MCMRSPLDEHLYVLGPATTVDVDVVHGRHASSTANADLLLIPCPCRHNGRFCVDACARDHERGFIEVHAYVY